MGRFVRWFLIIRVKLTIILVPIFCQTTSFFNVMYFYIIMQSSKGVYMYVCIKLFYSPFITSLFIVLCSMIVWVPRLDKNICKFAWRCLTYFIRMIKSFRKWFLQGYLGGIPLSWVKSADFYCFICILFP